MNWDPVETIAAAGGSVFFRVVVFVLGSCLTLALVMLLSAALLWELPRIDPTLVCLAVLMLPMLVVGMLFTWGYWILIGLICFMGFVWFFVQSLKGDHFLSGFLRSQACLALLVSGADGFESSRVLASLLITAAILWTDRMYCQRVGLFPG